ncbi:hypothetical protein QE417_003501 [Mucilaginibacter terrae]|uniref:Uncharacterized protein n=1 Tax=Mucilaginibacter terrae TaxID=1955052 RepID=A0ABU3GXD2_9SPHI|nr:hypothetical protein [Mucilaginibacter terrae]
MRNYFKPSFFVTIISGVNLLLHYSFWFHLIRFKGYEYSFIVLMGFYFPVVLFVGTVIVMFYRNKANLNQWTILLINAVTIVTTLYKLWQLQVNI